MKFELQIGKDTIQTFTHFLKDRCRVLLVMADSNMPQASISSADGLEKPDYRSPHFVAYTVEEVFNSFKSTSNIKACKKPMR